MNTRHSIAWQRRPRGRRRHQNHVNVIYIHTQHRSCINLISYRTSTLKTLLSVRALSANLCFLYAGFCKKKRSFSLFVCLIIFNLFLMYTYCWRYGILVFIKWNELLINWKEYCQWGFTTCNKHITKLDILKIICVFDLV